jgi:hypothetical protein
MAKQKKKPSPKSLQKLAEAHHKNAFYKMLSRICQHVASENIFSHFSSEELELIYLNRFEAPEFRAAPGHSIPGKMLDATKYKLLVYLKRTELSLIPDGFKISLFDYLTVGRTFISYLKVISDHQFPKSFVARQKLHLLIDSEQTVMSEASQLLQGILNYASCWDSDFRHRMYSVEYQSACRGNSFRIRNQFLLYSHKLDQAEFTIDGRKRPAFLLCWKVGEYGYKPLHVKASQLKLPPVTDDPVLDVFIQSHALLRLSERLDCFSTGFLQLNLLTSVQNFNCVVNHKNRILIEYRIFDTKAGYLSASVIDGALLIRTFLFVTSSGTPEGKKLEQISGLKKLDKKYLAIDKLSAFMNSDIGYNPVVREMIEKAGCSCLFSIYAELKGFATVKNHQNTALLLEQYLKSSDPEGPDLSPQPEEGEMKKETVEPV